MQRFRAIGRLSNSNISVLTMENQARAKNWLPCTHKHSPRKAMQFVPLNVAAIPKELIESELFGHEKVPLSTNNELVVLSRPTRAPFS